MTPQHRADMFIDPGRDPREGGTRLGDERATLNVFLRCQRLTRAVDRSKYRPAGPATAEPSPIAAMTVVPRLVTERGGACQRRKLADPPL
jgi:hypothetical protein